MSRPRDIGPLVRELLLAGHGNAEIIKQTGCAKATITYHAKKLGIGDRRQGEKANHDWSAIQRFYDEGHSRAECKRRFGFADASWYKAVERGDIVSRDHRIPLDELLVDGRKTTRDHLKRRLAGTGLLAARCERCGIREWMGEMLNLHLHHKNGKGDDNRLENLEMLCPNCHSLTETYCGKNIGNDK